MLKKNYQAKPSFWEKNLNFENIWNTVDFGICILDIVNHGAEFCVIGFNAGFAKISPLPIECLLGKTLTEAFPLEIACSYSRYCTECVQSGQTVYFEQHFQSDGKETYLFSVVPLKDDKLHIYELVITVTNISREVKFRHFVENVTDLIYSIASDGTFIYLSPQFTEVWGYDIHEFLGKSFATLVHPEDLPNLNEFFHHILDTAQKQKGIEFRTKRKDGSWCWITCNNYPTIDTDGNVIGFHGIARDITERKTAEEALRESEAQLREKTWHLEQALKELQITQTQLVQREKMSSLGQMVAGVAHEINNPTSFIYSNIQPAKQYIQSLLDLIQLYQRDYPHPGSEIQEKIKSADLEFLMADLPKLLNSMETGAERIMRIVLELRNFSRMDEAELKAVDIHEGINSTIIILEHRLKAQHKRPVIQVIKKYKNLPLVTCYASQLNQVFLNILVNAIDALDECPPINEAPTIYISTDAYNGNLVVIRITDNGPGIPLDIQQRLFDPFFTTKAVGKGTGMGLSISYQIVKKHQGSLNCISTPGKGSEFVIEIPLH
ncbi:MAG: PAS domain S-box protein [Nostoc sp.]|uniref:PAS domain-containing sensor histidine kinase n=1 Tax=Nostoc sp. TaxID=1180 RepID=UPI002FF1E113